MVEPTGLNETQKIQRRHQYKNVNRFIFKGQHLIITPKIVNCIFESKYIDTIFTTNPVGVTLIIENNAKQNTNPVGVTMIIVKC